MMKKIIFAIMAVVAMVACSNDEVILQAANEAIGFSDTFVDNSTRSVKDPSYVNTNEGIFPDFAVYGFVEGQILFNGTTVSKSIENDELSSAWKYTGTQYWIDGANYNFSAIAPVTGKNWSATATTAANTKLSFTNNGEQDMVYAQTNTIPGKATGNSAVSFSFRHTLSKVKFSFKNSYNAPNTTIRVRNITITDAYSSATVTLTVDTTVWSEQSNETPLVLNFGNATVASADALEAFAYNTEAESYYERLLIPHSTARDYAVTYSYDILVNGAVVKSFDKGGTVKDFAPEAGHAYDIFTTITPGEAIEFTVNDVTGITGWENGTNPTM